MKSKILAALSGILVFLIAASPVFAAVAYVGTIRVTSDATYSNWPVTAPVNLTSIINAGYCNAQATDLTLDNGTYYTWFMPASDRINFIAPSVPVGQSTYYLRTSNETLATEFPIIPGSGGNVTVADDPALEPGGNFTITALSRFDTSAGNVNRTLAYKAGAISISQSSTGHLNANVTGGENVTADLSSGYKLVTIGIEPRAPDPPAGYTMIYDVDDLQAINDDLTGNYMLANDIDASDTETWNSGRGFVPIGYLDDGTSLGTFTGVLDGNGSSITNLHINRDSNHASGISYLGLFKSMYGNVKHLTIEDADIDGVDSQIGTLAYEINGAGGGIDDVHIVNANLTLSYSTGYDHTYAGVMAVSATGNPTISNCTTSGSISALNMGEGNTYLAGFIETMYSSTVTDCSVDVDITGTASADNAYIYAFGFAHNIYNDSTFTRCGVTGDVSITTGTLGGHSGGNGFWYHAGSSSGDASNFTDCYSTMNFAIDTSDELGQIFSGFSFDLGYNLLYSVNYTRCYAANTLTHNKALEHGAGFAMDIIGHALSYTEAGVFWDGEASGIHTSTAGTEKTTAQMKAEGTFTGYDFDTVWDIDGTTNGGYPFLRSPAPYTPLNFDPVTTLYIDIDGVEVSTPLTANVTDTASDWVFMDGSLMPYTTEFSMSVNGTEVIKYRPTSYISGTTLPDRTGTAQNGVFNWGTNPAGLTGELISFKPASSTSVSGSGPGGMGSLFPDTPDIIPEMYTEGDMSKLPGGAIIDKLLEEAEVPKMLWWIPFIYFGIAVVGLAVYAATRAQGSPGSVFTMWLVMEILMAVFAVMGATPFWPVILFIIPGLALSIKQNQYSW